VTVDHHRQDENDLKQIFSSDRKQNWTEDSSS